MIPYRGMGKRPHRACPAPHWAGGDCPSNGRLSTAAAAARRAYRNDSTIIHDAGRFVHCHFIGKGGEKFATFTQSRNEGRGGENERWWITMWKEFKTMQKIFKKIRNSRRQKTKKGEKPLFWPRKGARAGNLFIFTDCGSVRRWKIGGRSSVLFPSVMV